MRSIKFLQGKILTTLKVLSIILAGLYIAYSWPNTNLYYEITAIHLDTQFSDNIVVNDIIRKIKRPFVGSYLVKVIKENPEDGSYSTFCTGNGKLKYTTDTKIKKPTSLSWWIGNTSNEDCKNSRLPVGKYYIETCWYIERPLSFTIELCNDSNIFRVINKTNTD